MPNTRKFTREESQLVLVTQRLTMANEKIKELKDLVSKIRAFNNISVDQREYLSKVDTELESWILLDNELGEKINENLTF